MDITEKFLNMIGIVYEVKMMTQEELGIAITETIISRKTKKYRKFT